MKIHKIGTFTKEGHPTGWNLEGDEVPEGFEAATTKPFAPHCLGVSNPTDPFCPVTVNGVEIVEWTQARTAAMS